jgi:hypothetical protein
LRYILGNVADPKGVGLSWLFFVSFTLPKTPKKPYANGLFIRKMLAYAVNNLFSRCLELFAANACFGVLRAGLRGFTHSKRVIFGF